MKRVSVNLQTGETSVSDASNVFGKDGEEVFYGIASIFVYHENEADGLEKLIRLGTQRELNKIKFSHGVIDKLKNSKLP